MANVSLNMILTCVAIACMLQSAITTSSSELTVAAGNTSSNATNIGNTNGTVQSNGASNGTNNGTNNGNPSKAHGLQVSAGSVVAALLFMVVFERIVQ